MATVFYCCSFLIWQAKVFLWIFSKQKKNRKSEKNISQWKAKKIVPRPACQTPATLSQEFAFPLAMLSFVICVFHENMRCIRSYIVSLSIYVCVYRNVVKYFVEVARAIIRQAREAAENREQVGEARERERESEWDWQTTGKAVKIQLSRGLSPMPSQFRGSNERVRCSQQRRQAKSGGKFTEIQQK